MKIRWIEVMLVLGLALMAIGLTILISSLIACEGCEVGPLDRGRMTTTTGLELRPEFTPWEVVISEEVEHADAVVDAIESINGWLGEEALIPYVDQSRFDELDVDSAMGRVGTIIVYEGFAGTGEWLEELDWTSPGGLADLRWDEDGLIQYADIVISSDIAYHWQTVRDVAAHELGHGAFGLAHDDSSLDLGSCMASPPEHDCEYTEKDVALILEEL